VLAGGLGHGRDGFKGQILAGVGLRFDFLFSFLLQLFLLGVIDQVDSEFLAEMFEGADRGIEVLASLSEHPIVARLGLSGLFLEFEEFLLALGD